MHDHPDTGADLAELTFAPTLARLSAVWPEFAAVCTPAGGGWVPLTDQLDAPAITRLLGEVDAHLQGGVPVAAQSLVNRLAGPACMVAAAAVFLERRLPAPGRDHLKVRWNHVDNGPLVSEVSFGTKRWVVLYDDTAAGDPGIETASDLTELQDALAGWVHEMFAPLVEEVSRQSRRGRRALWQGLADRIAGGFLEPGKQIGAADRARTEATATLGRAPRPLRGVPDWLEIEHEGASHLFKRKAVCCLYYKVPAYLDEYCSTCPLIERGESVRRLTDHVAAG